MLDRQNQIELAKAAAKASLNPSVAYSFGNEKMNAAALDAAFVKELNELGKNPHDYERNKQTIFELMEISLS